MLFDFDDAPSPEFAHHRDAESWKSLLRDFVENGSSPAPQVSLTEDGVEKSEAGEWLGSLKAEVRVVVGDGNRGEAGLDAGFQLCPVATAGCGGFESSKKPAADIM